MTRKAFSVRLFLQDGCADGVKVVSRSKWSGRGLVIPRPSLAAELGRAELKAPGVYLLAGSAAEDRPTLCIGAADPVCDGLAESGTEEQSWSTAIIFTCKENRLSFAQYRFIAMRLLQLAGSAGKAATGRNGGEPVALSRAEDSAATTFLDSMLSLYPLFGVTVFDCQLDRSSQSL